MIAAPINLLCFKTSFHSVEFLSLELTAPSHHAILLFIVPVLTSAFPLQANLRIHWIALAPQMRHWKRSMMLPMKRRLTRLSARLPPQDPPQDPPPRPPRIQRSMQPSAISMSCECKVASDDISIYIYLHTFDDFNFCSGKRGRSRSSKRCEGNREPRKKGETERRR